MLGLQQYAVLGAVAGMVALGVWAGVERNGRKDAEKALVDQQNKWLEEANKQWGAVADARNQFDEAVRDGLGKMRVLQDAISSGNQEFQRLVASDPGGKTELTPAELAALRVLANRRANQPAGGGAIRSAKPSP